RWCVPLWDRHCSSVVSCFWSTRGLYGSCFTCSCWAMRNPHFGGSLVPHTRRTERTFRGGGRGSHRGRQGGCQERPTKCARNQQLTPASLPTVARSAAGERQR